MSPEHSKHPESRLQKLMELRWQLEIIERWIQCSGTPGDSHAQLQEMLDHVKSELRTLEAKSPAGKADANLKQAD
jgi:hypothetical protein